MNNMHTELVRERDQSVNAQDSCVQDSTRKIKHQQEKTRQSPSAIALGFMPLTDCAPLVIAQEKGYFAKYGLKVTLERQNSWATMRDKLHTGHIDAAQLLAPMAIASSLGINGNLCHVIAPMVLSQNGNAITLSAALYDQIMVTHNLPALDLPLSAGLLKPIIEQRKESGKKLRFATVYPHSCHYYQLCHWLDINNVSLGQVDIVIISPSNMVEALKKGEIDGFCVGGPYNAQAVRDKVGATCVTSCDIWPNVPEKVLGMRAAWQQENPSQSLALIAALQEACNWLSNVANRFEAALVLSQPNYLDLDLSVIAPSLIGSCLVHHAISPRHIPAYNQFAGANEQCVNQPTLYNGEWLLNAMLKSNHIDSSLDIEEVIEQVFKPHVYKQALAYMPHSSQITR